MIFNFGKYKGKRIEHIPESYLVWCAKNLKDEEIVEEIYRELGVRAVEQYQEEPPDWHYAMDPLWDFGDN